MPDDDPKGGGTPAVHVHHHAGGGGGGGSQFNGGDIHEHPRFKEVYAEMKKFERERDEAVAKATEWEAKHTTAVAEHTQALETETTKFTALEATANWSANLVDIARGGFHDAKQVEYIRYKFDNQEVEEGKEALGFDAFWTKENEGFRTMFSVKEGAPPPKKAPKDIDDTKPPANHPDTSMDGIMQQLENPETDLKELAGKFGMQR